MHAVTTPQRSDTPPVGDPPRWSAVWTCGPAAGRTIPLPVGHHRIGRSPLAEIRCRDATVAPFHAALDVAPDGGLRLVQLAGRSPLARSAAWSERLEPVGPAVLELDPFARIGDGAGGGGGGAPYIDLGASRLTFLHRPVGEGVVGSTDGAGRHVAECSDGAAVGLVRRAPLVTPAWAPTPVALPSAAAMSAVPIGGLVPALLGLVGAALIAVVLHQPMFFLFGLIGGLVAVGGWGVQRWTAWRRRRRGHHTTRSAMREFADSLGAQRRAHEAHHRAFVGSLETAVGDVLDARAGLWARRGTADAFVASTGLGDVRWEPVLDSNATVPDACWPLLECAGVHRDAPVAVDLGSDVRLGVCGRDAMAVVRSLLVQLAARVGPADWQLVIVSDHPEHWRWAEPLPHVVRPASVPASTSIALDDAGAAALCREVEALVGRHTVVVTDQWAALAVRTSPVRRLAAGEAHPALIVVCPTILEVPAMCRSVVDATAAGHGRWLVDLSSGGLPQPLRYAGIHLDDAMEVADRLGRLIDPEDARHAGGGLPRSTSLVGLLGASNGELPTAESIAAAWRAAPPDAAPATPIGAAADGTVDIDLVRDGPHALLAGTTGAGKSELLRTLVLGLATRLPPSQMTFVLVDYKGGATFDCCLPLPHVVGLVTDLDDRLAERALRSLRAELQRRERVLRRYGAADLAAARRSTGEAVLPRLLVVIDEFAALAVEQPGFLHALVGIAQRGRSLGVHLLLATQRPSGVISDDIRANTNLRMALRLHDVADANDVIGDPAPSLLPRDVPGRAVMRLGPGEFVEFQTAHVGATVAGGGTEAEYLARAVVDAAALVGTAPPHRPWHEPLPLTIEPVDLVAAAPGAIGVVDLPDAQEQRPLRWLASSGNLLVVGARGAGVTSTLRTAAIAALDQPPGDTELFVVDALGDPAWDDTATHPRCGGVVRLHERERLMRLLRGLAAPRSGVGGGDGAPRPHMILVIDGLAALRTELDAIERSVESDALTRIALGTVDARITLMVGSPDAASVPVWLLSRCPHRWLLHVDDRHEAAVLGMSGMAATAGVPGRAIVSGSVDGSTEPAEVQFVRPMPLAAHGHPASTTLRLDVLSSVVDATGLDRGERDAEEWRCPIGTSFDDLATHCVSVPDGEHLIVLGPARSGRSTVLARLLRAWAETAAERTVDSPAWSGVLAPRRSPLRAHASVVDHLAIDVLDLLRKLPPSGPALLVIDDAELVDDVDGRLGALAASRRPGLVLAVAGRGESLRAAYGHWTGAVRRSRRGVLMAGCHESDGDLLGVTLPRRSPIAIRPGLAYAIEDGVCTLVQIGIDPVSEAAEDTVLRRRSSSARRRGSTTGLTAVS